LLAAGAAIASSSGIAEAREARRSIDLRAATLPEALAELSRETAASFGTEGPLPDLRTPAIRGEMTIAEALSRLLANSDYAAKRVGSVAWRIVRRPDTTTTPRSMASAQPAASQAPAPIIVTGTKQSQPLADLPMALSVVQPEHLRRLDPAADTSWLSGEIDGLTLTNLGPGRNRMFLRGVADSPFNGESQSTVAVVLDDARLTYAAPDPDIRLVDVNRVEVLKGPQGALYGTGALGGIYHIVTNRPELDKTSLTASIGGEAVAQGGVGYSGSAVANLPLASAAALRLVGYSAHEPGWVDTGTRSNSNTGTTLGARAGIAVDTGGQWRLDLTAFGQWLTSRDSQYVYSPGARSRPAQVAEPHDNDLRHLSGRLERHSDDVDISFSSGFTWHEVGDSLDATFGAGSFGLLHPRSLTDDHIYRVWDSEIRIAAQTKGVAWLIGLSHVSSRQERTLSLLDDTNSQSLTVDAEHRSSTDTAAFGNVSAPLSGPFTLSLGARLFHSVVSQSGSLLASTAADERRRDGVTPSASLSWEPKPGRLIFIRYGTAFRQGVIGITASGAPQALKDDVLATIEAGWRETLPGGLQLDIGSYFTWWKNLQSDILLPSGLIGTQSAGDAQIAGLEAAFDGRVTSNWSLHGGISIVHSQLVKATFGLAVDDSRLPVVPDYTLRGAIEYEGRVGRASANIRMQLRYLGPARLSFDPALDRPMGNVLESSVQARFDVADWAIYADISNLFGNSSDTFAYGNPLRFPTQEQVTPQRPFSISLRLMRNF
jgi:outer membrane receptor protein involved in Fe transport